MYPMNEKSGCFFVKAWKGYPPTFATSFEHEICPVHNAVEKLIGQRTGSS